jgi:hypothetical protein
MVMSQKSENTEKLVKGQALLMGVKGCFASIVALLDSKEVEVQSQVCALIMELCRDNGNVLNLW